jgi:hypothetical protein
MPSGPNTKLLYFIAYALHQTKLHSCMTFTALVLLQCLKALFPTACSAPQVTICSSCIYDHFESDMQYLKVPVLNANVKLAYAEDRWNCKAREDGIVRMWYVHLQMF